ncbi:MAG: hypothetical protein GY811_29465 [Myxococcales bacterium]|nr:hypothetical protein [Myxococcales bacterium]
MSKDDTGEDWAGASSKEIRGARVRRMLRRFAVWVVAPTLLGIVYYGFIAAPQYDSVGVIRVQSKGGGKSNAKQVDSMLVKEYAESRTMLEYLVASHELKNHYEKGGDFASRLSSGASSEDLYDYFREKVTLEYQSESGSLRLTVRAFSGEVAQQLADAILRAAEEMTNSTDGRARTARTTLAADTVAEAEEQLVAAQLALTAIVIPESTELSLPSTDEMARLETARYMRDLARAKYEAALTAQEKVQVALVREQLYIAVVSKPSEPTGEAHPRRIWGILTVFVLSFVLMGVFTMLGATLKEHARF